jgi:hypothetical protein
MSPGMILSISACFISAGARFADTIGKASRSFITPPSFTECARRTYVDLTKRPAKLSENLVFLTLAPLWLALRPRRWISWLTFLPSKATVLREVSYDPAFAAELDIPTFEPNSGKCDCFLVFCRLDIIKVLQ